MKKFFANTAMFLGITGTFGILIALSIGVCQWAYDYKMYFNIEEQEFDFFDYILDPIVIWGASFLIVGITLSLLYSFFKKAFYWRKNSQYYQNELFILGAMSIVSFGSFLGTHFFLLPIYESIMGPVGANFTESFAIPLSFIFCTFFSIINFPFFQAIKHRIFE